MLGLCAKPATPCEDRHLRKINCTLQNAPAEKAAWWAAGWHAGLALKSLLKVRLMCKFGDAEERAAFRSTHSRCSALLRNSAHSASAQPLLRLLQLRYRSSAKSIAFANCTCRKSCVVGCDVLRGVGG